MAKKVTEGASTNHTHCDLSSLCFDWVFLSGIFSSNITGGVMNEALLLGRECDQDLADTNMGHYVKSKSSPGDTSSQQTLDYLTYAMQCYRNETYAGLQSCDTLSKSALEFTSDFNASCPFSGDICKSQTDNIRLDTGHVDSYKHLGMMRGPRFLLRRVVQCAPIVTDGYTITQPDPNDSYYQFVNYTYGNTTWAPHTYQMRYLVKQNETLRGPPDYSVYVRSTQPGDNPQEFIPELSVPSAETSLFFLDTSRIVYEYKTEDPWFSATKCWVKKVQHEISQIENNVNSSLCAPDQPATPVACTATQLYCKPGLQGDSDCINFKDENNFVDKLAKTWPNPADQAVLHPIFRIINDQVRGGASAFYSAKGLPNLLSRITLLGSNQRGVIPGDKWKMEFEYLYQATLAAIQFKVLDYARGFSEGILMNHCGTSGLGCRRLCHSQKIRSPHHYSFSVLGLSFVLVGGTLITILSIFLEKIVRIVAKMPKLNLHRNPKFIYAYAEWQANSTLQLQRQAHENLGLGNWSRTDEAVPVTESDDNLGVLDVSDKRHPRLVGISKEMVSVDCEVDKCKPGGRYEYLSSTEEL